MAAATAADAAPVLVDYGDLRQAGDLEELQRRLEQNGGDIEEYLSALERISGVQPTTADPRERLAALADVTFDGVPDDWQDREDFGFLPADDEDFRMSWEIEEAPDEDYRGYTIIATAMSSDIPSDIYEEFAVTVRSDTPVYSALIDEHVDRDRLGALVEALEARGYTVVQD